MSGDAVAATDAVTGERDERFLRSEALQIMIQVIYAAAALWAVGLGTVWNDGRPISWLLPFGLTIAAATSHWLARRWEVWAGIWLPLGLLLLISLYLCLRVDALAPFFVVPVILIANVVAPMRSRAALAAAACASLAFISWWREGAVSSLYLSAISVTGVTAFTAWLSTRNLYLALSWALFHREQARRSMEDLRERRAELAHLAHMLRDNQERLHYMNIRLQHAKLAAEEAYRMKQYFVASISHELRTPLNLIVGFSEMMVNAPESYGGALLPAAYRGDVMAIYRSARHLGELIDDVLDLAQIEADRMPLVKEVADLREVVRESAEMVRDLIRAKGVEFESVAPAEPLPVRLDRTRIRQVLLNVLSNAARHTAQGWIRVQITSKAQEAIVAIQDTGTGIAPEQLARAFEVFAQLTEAPGEGSGLGLALSKRFVELHGGRMWMESHPGNGTCVSFALPLVRGGREVVTSQPVSGLRPPSHLGATQVLVASDDARVLPMLSRHIEGYEFVLAGSPAAASEIVRERAPSAVIMDAAWAERGGTPSTPFDLAPEVPIIVCPLPNVSRAGRLLGAVDYLAKPVTREGLSRALARLPSAPRTVLVVDDNVHVARLLARMVRTHDPGIHVLQAFNGRDALQIARSQRPDLILLDLIMPDVSGHELLGEITSDGALRGTPVIIVSVRAVEEERAPVGCELRVTRASGLSLTEVIRALGAVLPVVAPRAAAAPAGASAPPGGQPGLPA